MQIRSGVVVLGVLAAVTVSPGVAFADALSSSGEDATSQSPTASTDTRPDARTETESSAPAPQHEATEDATADEATDEATDEVADETADELADEVNEDPETEEIPAEASDTEQPADENSSDGDNRADVEPVAADPSESPEPTDEPGDEPEVPTDESEVPTDEPEVEPAAETGGAPEVGRNAQPAPSLEADVDTVESASTELATMTVAAASSAAEAVTPSPLELIGSWLFSALAGLVRLFDPKPSIPAGSLVTRHTSELEVGCGCGETLDADWYFPNQVDEPVGLIYLQHGFFRSKANVSALAVQLAEQTNSVVVVPTVASNPFAQGGCWVNGDAMHRAVADLFVGDMTALTASATEAAGHPVTLPTQYVLAGQSAGGNLAAAAARYTTDSDAIDRLRAVVMFDGVDNGGRIAAGSAALTGANARPVFQIAADCGLCNVFGAGTSALEDSRPDSFVGVRLEGGKHTDAEGPSTGLIGMLTCGVPNSANVAAVPVIAAGWINDVFTGSQDGLYGAGGQRFHIGEATAVVLGTGTGLARSSAPVDVGWSEY